MGNGLLLTSDEQWWTIVFDVVIIHPSVDNISHCVSASLICIGQFYIFIKKAFQILVRLHRKSTVISACVRSTRVVVVGSL